MKQGLKQAQQQKFILSPQMREYLHLLHLPVADLRRAVDQALEENPTLEETVSGEPPDIPEPSASARSREDEENDSAAAIQGEWENSDPLGFFAAPVDFSKRPAADLRRTLDFQENLLTRPESLFDFLEWQLNFLDLAEKERPIAMQIIGNVAEDGYLTATVDEIADTLGTNVGDVLRVLEKIQKFDPPGVAARDLREALLIQLERKGADGALAKEIVREHLDLVAKRDFKTLSRIFNQSETAIKTAVAFIGKLEPKPGRSFYAEDAVAVTPDATISIKDGTDNDLEIRVNDEYVPKLRLNAEYRKMLRDRNTDQQTRDFLKTRLASGADFIKALELRTSTIRGITEEIVRAQPLFFTRGFSYLRPLRLKDIAERLGLHESTVSRAIHGKYMSTPQGTVPYRSFFSQKIETRDGIGESQKSILERIRSLVKNENPRSPLSDEAIVQTLKAEGIRIARRTVSKYRDILKILPTHLRRQR
ncbi:MAG: RNA polymerase sigma-54 factor [Candidatus Omnitrophica bacterium ADurb.Bin277]|nr:MAG: RNA polymerase sigma-54 factor [Candidatus Omnitrophica bacterium ADurb.Bin277]